MVMCPEIAAAGDKSAILLAVTATKYFVYVIYVFSSYLLAMVWCCDNLTVSRTFLASSCWVDIVGDIELRQLTP